MEGCLDIMGSAAIAEAAVLQQMARRDEGNSVRRFSSSAFAHDDHEAQWHGHVRRRRLSQRSGGQGRENSAVQRGIAGGLDENGIFYSALRIQVNFDLDPECDGVDLRIRQQPLIDFRLRTLPIGPEGGVGNGHGRGRGQRFGCDHGRTGKAPDAAGAGDAESAGAVCACSPAMENKPAAR